MTVNDTGNKYNLVNQHIEKKCGLVIRVNTKNKNAFFAFYFEIKHTHAQYWLGHGDGGTSPAIFQWEYKFTELIWKGIESRYQYSQKHSYPLNQIFQFWEPILKKVLYMKKVLQTKKSNTAL